jgi:hypothetical protein
LKNGNTIFVLESRSSFKSMLLLYEITAVEQKFQEIHSNENQQTISYRSCRTANLGFLDHCIQGDARGSADLIYLSTEVAGR